MDSPIITEALELYSERMKGLIVIAVAVVAFLVGVAYFSTADHWWWKVHSAKVTYKGEYSPFASVYRSQEGSLLINLESNGDYLYEVHYFPQGKIWLVGRCQAWNFYFPLNFAYSRNMPPPCVDMGGPKIEIDPKLIVRENHLEFISAELTRVRVQW